MTHPGEAGGHPDDGALLRLVDGAGPSDERARTRAHLDRCTRCGARLDVIRRDRARLFSLLAEEEAEHPLPPLQSVPGGAETHPAVHHSRPRRRRAGVAAAIALVCAAAVAVQPVRAWMAALWHDAVAVVAPDGDDRSTRLETDAAASDGATPWDGSALSSGAPILVFVPARDRFRLEFSRVPPDTRATVRIEHSPAASVEVLGGSLDGIRTRPDGLAISAPPTPGVRYRIVLPETVRRVVASVDGRAVATIEVDSAGLPLERTFALPPSAGD